MTAESRPIRGAWIEMAGYHYGHDTAGSRPIRGAWIEISACKHRHWLFIVAPHTGRVD